MAVLNMQPAHRRWKRRCKRFKRSSSRQVDECLILRNAVDSSATTSCLCILKSVTRCPDDSLVLGVELPRVHAHRSRLC